MSKTSQKSEGGAWLVSFKQYWQLGAEFAVLVGGVMARVAAPVPNNLRGQSLTSIGTFGTFMMTLGFLIAIPFFSRYNHQNHVKYWSIAALLSFAASVSLFLSYSDQLGKHLFTYTPNSPSAKPVTIMIGDQLTGAALDRVETTRQTALAPYLNPIGATQEAVFSAIRNDLLARENKDPLAPMTAQDLMQVYANDPTKIWTQNGIQRETDRLDLLYLGLISAATLAAMFAVQAISCLPRPPRHRQT